MQLDILTPDKKVYSGEVNAVNLPGADGAFEVLKGHAALISTLERGTVRVKDVANKETTFEIDGGVAEVLKDKVIVLAEAVLG